MNAILLKAAGYVYRNAYLILADFRERYGFNPMQYPNYFRLTAGGLVEATKLYAIDVDICFAHSRRMTNMLTERFSIALPLVEGQEDNRS